MVDPACCEQRQWWRRASAALTPSVGPLWYVNSALVSGLSDPKFPQLNGESLATRGV